MPLFQPTQIEDDDPKQFCYLSQKSIDSGKVTRLIKANDGKIITHFCKKEPDLTKSQMDDLVFVGLYRYKDLSW